MFRSLGFWGSVFRIRHEVWIDKKRVGFGVSEFRIWGV